MERVIQRFSGEPQFMQKTTDPRTAARHARIDSAAPDVQAFKGRLTMEQLEKLARMDND